MCANNFFAANIMFLAADTIAKILLLAYIALTANTSPKEFIGYE